jgi:chemotaxis protein MotA
MADSAQKKLKRPAPSPVRLDLATFLGIAIALAGILGGLVLEKGGIQDVAQLTAAMIVLGGTLGAVLVTHPLSIVMGAFRSLRNIFVEPGNRASETIETLIRFATAARRNGIVSLESDAESIADPFLRKAMNLAIDGADLQELRRIMEIDIDVLEQEGEAEVRVWETAGGYAPTIGILGAVMGLIQVMKHLEDIRMVGHGIAVAFVATVYGVGFANIFFLPAATKLRSRVQQSVMLREMTLEGVAGIAQGLNPALIRLKLEGYGRQAPQKRSEGKSAAKERAMEAVSARS